MATPGAQKRLTREYANIQRDPPPYIVAHPSEANILEWHYILTGPPNTPYEGGQYWGSLVFPRNYPFEPPAIRMHTPSGRFRPSDRLCLSISDFHPKSFNPAWSVATILNGLLSFMNGEEMTAGSISNSPAERKFYAARSRWWNSTGGGSATTPTPGVQHTTKGVGNIKAGDCGVKFRAEWPDEDAQNWQWLTENRIDPKTGKCLPDPPGQNFHCSPETAALRKRLGGINSAGALASGGEAVREAGQGWLTKRSLWYAGGLLLLYVILVRTFGEVDLMAICGNLIWIYAGRGKLEGSSRQTQLDQACWTSMTGILTTSTSFLFSWFAGFNAARRRKSLPEVLGSGQ